MRFVFVASLFVFLSLPGFSQISRSSTQHESFAGTWIFNSKKSTANYRGDKVTWVVSLTENEFRIQKTHLIGDKPIAHQVFLFVDSRGEKNVVPAIRDAPEHTIFSKSKWDKNTLIRRYKSFSYPMPAFTTELVEKYSLSKDGNQLIVESRIVTSDFPDQSGRLNLPVISTFDRQK